MIITGIIFFLLTLGYALLMIIYRIGWALQEPFVLGPDKVPALSISVIIPARNEAQNIEACVRSVLKQKYPAYLFEVIVIDDHSDDNTVEIVKSIDDMRLHCVSLREYLKDKPKTNAYKKQAITAGIESSKGELIVTTDADCIAPENWLRDLAAKYEKDKVVMVVAPVTFTCDGRLVERFQLIDFMSMQGITAASGRLKLGNMSNGANLAFSKRAFWEVNGYKGIDHLASGDDYLLMNKLQKAFPGKVGYIKSRETVVTTLPQPGWKSFFRQRIRWASKSGKYDDKKMTAILLLVYLFNLSLLVAFLLGFWHPVYFLVSLSMLFVKALSELCYLLPVARFFNEERQLPYLILLQPLHITYIILAGFLGLVGTYKWKGRSVR